MEAEVYWEIFWNTGAPEAYLLYKEAQRESEPVSA